MSVAAIDRLRDEVIVDRRAAGLVVLFVVVLVPTVWLTALLHGAGADPTLPGGVEEPGSGPAGPAAGGLWVLAEVVFAGVALVGIVAYKRAPEWLQTIIKWDVLMAIFMYAGARWATDGSLGVMLPVTIASFSLAYAADELGLWWVLNNLGALFLAILFGAFIGILFSVEALLVALVGLTLYDHLFANKREWMFTLAGAALRMRLPLLFLAPATWRFDWDEMVDASEDPEADGGIEDHGWGIGTADLLLPAAFAGAVAIAPGGYLAGGTAAAVAVCAGILVACFRLRHRMERGSGAGLPALTTGAFGGLAIATIITYGATLT